jgi:sugar O-acyltransferase (sialic acid O-acetyltransferase NeuD family)
MAIRRSGAQKRLLIAGAGGHGRVVADCAEAMGDWSSIVFFDDRWPDLQHNLHWPVVGNISTLIESTSGDDKIFIGIGSAAARMHLLGQMKESKSRLATVIHPSAIVSRYASIGQGSLVVAGAVINIGAQIGDGCIVNTGATVDHDCRLANGVHVCPGAHLAGNVTIGANSWIGIGACVREGMTIGSNVTIGAGATVVCHFANDTTGLGTPAKTSAKILQSRG